MQALRFRLRFDEMWQFRAHAHPAGDDVTLHWPRPPKVDAPTPIALEVEISGRGQFVPVRGTVIPNYDGSAKVELPQAAGIFASDSTAWRRKDRRVLVDVAVLVNRTPLRMIEVSIGGARLEGAAAAPDAEISIEHPGIAVPLFATVAWTEPSAFGVRWLRSDLTTRSQARRLFELALDDWQQAALLAHPPACPCASRAPKISVFR